MLGAAVWTVGCGYHFAASGSALPKSANTIYVARFSNSSRITGINDEFARYLKDEIANHRRLEVVDDPANADLTLTGAIHSAEMAPSAFNAVAEPTAYNYNLSVDAKLTDNHAKKVIWSTNGLSRMESYSIVPQAVVATSPEFLRQNLRAQDIANMPDAQVAATQLSSTRGLTMEELARDIYAGMSEGF